MKKKIFIVSIGFVTVCFAGMATLLALIPEQIPIMPSDSELISEYFNQALPGYTSITILDQQGKGRGDDPRLLTLQVVMDTGSKPTSCEGKLKMFISDPSYFSFTWNTLDCVGQNLLIRWAQHAIESEQNYDCHREEIASLLAYWVQNEKLAMDQITDWNLHSVVERIRKDNKVLPDQITLLNPSQIRVKDLDPFMPNDQKRTKYILKCDGTIDLYLAKEYFTFNQITTGIGDTYLDSPLEIP
ncbi:hypothetical protein [Anaerolinea sp.]|uniref:hypothetical protein n=1 Tax=Anaerolinea sp. TaxID=1872519 RepID=UPI002ACDC784|nr:hypothetical protein [Anaerolinea sp.]